MNYIDLLKDFIDNFYFTTYPRDFKLKPGTQGEDKIIEGEALAICNRGKFIEDGLLRGDFYKFGNKHIMTDKVFHRKDAVDFLKSYKKRNQGSFKSAMKSGKKVFMEMEMHLVSESAQSYTMFRQGFFDKLFRDKEIVKRIREGRFFIFLYLGWEADDFRKPERSKDKYHNWYEMFRSVLIDYKLPTNSIIIAQSNLLGYENEKEYDFKGIKPSMIFDNITEFQPFKAIARNHKLYPIYPIEEHFKSLRKSKHTLLRIHRTWHPHRDAMLYYLYKENYINKSLVQHREFDSHGECIAHRGPEHKEGFFDYETDYDMIEKIQKDIPIKSSEYEQNIELINNHLIMEQQHHISNEPIDNSVYEDSVFSWVSPSLPDKRNYIFINQSTFSPILHYHPILWLGHTHLIKYFKKCGFKSFDWLFDESYDDLTLSAEKFKANAKQINKIMNMDKDYLIDLMWDNRDTLQHNRDLLIECRSIERIIRKLYGIVNETEV